MTAEPLARQLAVLESGGRLPDLQDRSGAVAILTASAFQETARQSDELGHDV